MALFYMDMRTPGRILKNTWCVSKTRDPSDPLPGAHGEGRGRRRRPGGALCHESGEVADEIFDAVVYRWHGNSAGRRGSGREAGGSAQPNHLWRPVASSPPPPSGRAFSPAAPSTAPRTSPVGDGRERRCGGQYPAFDRGPGAPSPGRRSSRRGRGAGRAGAVGVFVCNCGLNIGGVADVPDIVAHAKVLPTWPMPGKPVYLLPGLPGGDGGKDQGA